MQDMSCLTDNRMDHSVCYSLGNQILRPFCKPKLGVFDITVHCWED